MSTNPKYGPSPSFMKFIAEAPNQAAVWMTAVQGLEKAGALDPKTGELAYLSVLAVMRLEGGIPLHVRLAKQAGASREEVISAILVGLPAAGQVVLQVLPLAIEVYDSE